MLYTKVIYSIRERLRQLVDDSDIDDREILFNVNNQRALFYRNQYNQRNRIVDEEVKQLLNVTMEQAPDEVCGNGVNCFLIKSTKPIPSTLELHHKSAVFKATSKELTGYPFSIVTWNQFPYTSLNKYTKNEIFVSIGPDGYLYAKSSNKLIKFVETILMTMILEDPTDIKDFILCPTGVGCFDLDTFDYPIKAYAFAQIVEQVMTVFLGKLQTPEDEENDSES